MKPSFTRCDKNKTLQTILTCYNNNIIKRPLQSNDFFTFHKLSVLYYNAFLAKETIVAKSKSESILQFKFLNLNSTPTANNNATRIRKYSFNKTVTKKEETN